jgi:sugar (pentulose or hexulose) kinase
MQILALDIGTSSVKAAVLDTPAGRPVGPVVKQAYPLHQPDADTAVIEPKELWQAISQAVSGAVAGQQVEGIGLSCLMPCLVLLDQRDQPIMPFVTHLDRRARPTARTLEARFGPSFLRETGNRPLPGGISGVFFKHWATHHPDQLSQVHRYLHLNSWIALRLTGQTAFDPGNACFTGLCNWSDVTWSPEWCSHLGVMPKWLPAIQPGNITVGSLRREIAEQWSLPADIPVKLGLADTSSAILAAEMERGDLLHLVGTTQVLAVLTDDPVPSANRLTRHFGAGESYLHVTHNPVGGAALEWLRLLCFADTSEEAFFGPVVDQALTRQPSVTLEPPYLGGDRLEIEEKRAGFKGLTLGADRLDLLAAVLAAMRTGHRTAWANLERPAPPRRVFLSGGAARVIRKLIPDYAQLDVIELDQASLRGVARLFA